MLFTTLDWGKIDTRGRCENRVVSSFDDLKLIWGNEILVSRNCMEFLETWDVKHV